MFFLRCVIVFAVAYLLGNISAGKIVAREIGHVDITKVGSGNAGTTNVLRTLGWVPSLLTFGGDILKALLSAFIGSLIAGHTGMCVAGVGVVVGHIWPALYGFKGGKGIAASFGFILFSDPLMALILLVEQVSVIAITRFMSVGSIISCVAYPVLTLILRRGDAALTATSVIIGAMALFSHRSNIARLAKGNENRLDFKRINEISRKKK